MERPGLNGSAARLGAMECLEPVTDRIGKNDQVPDAAFLGQCAGSARHPDAVFFQMPSQFIERLGVGDFPAVERRAFVLVGMDDDALLAVVHAQRQRAAALVDKLHAEEIRAVTRPILEIFGADTDITQGVEVHRGSPAGFVLIVYHIGGNA